MRNFVQFLVLVKAGRKPNLKMALFLLEINLTGWTRLDSQNGEFCVPLRTMRDNLRKTKKAYKLLKYL